MMKKLMAFAVLVSGATAVQAQPVDVGEAEWAKLPEARVVGNTRIGTKVAAEIERMGRERTCQVPGLGRSRVDISVPFAMEMNGANQVQRIVLKDLGCPELETLFGRVLQRMAANGEYAATKGAGWYRSSLDLSIE